MAEDIDLKMDDGVFNAGIVRGQCSNNNSTTNINYDSATEKCNTFFRLSLN